MDGLGDICLGGPLVALAQHPGEGVHGPAAVHRRGGGADANAAGRPPGGGDPGLGQSGAHEAGELRRGEGGGQVRVLGVESAMVSHSQRP